MSIALITGSSGHVGSNLVRKLSELDYKIRCIDFDGDHRAYEGYDVEIIKGDITDKDSLYEIFEGVDVVFHTAALINLDRRYREAIEFVNIEGTRNVCEVAIEDGHNYPAYVNNEQLLGLMLQMEALGACSSAGRRYKPAPSS